MNDMITPLTEYLNHDTDVYYSRPTAEEGHTKRCLASAMIAAVENWRDDEHTSDHSFRLWAQDNGVLSTADEYLDSELSDCICPPVKRMSKYYYTIRLHGAEGATMTDVLFCTLDDAVVEVTERASWDDDVKSFDVTFAVYGCDEEIVFTSLTWGNN